MENAVRRQIYRVVFVYVMLTALVVWQNHFIWVGINANPYLNGMIVAVFLFGSVKGILLITGMSNERTALEALKEAYSDALARRSEDQRNPLWRHYRCFEPGIVFRKPRLIGHIFDLALDEIARARGVRISIETMSALLHAVDRKISTERSLLTYLTGLSIFLGLIGTFIGLMEMVGSVGGIIGGLARSDDASAESIKQLIRDLEAPLVGMATGFSASLFGLFGSLVMGLLTRFGAQASNAVRDELETWLTQMARIEDEHQGGRALVTAGRDSGQIGIVSLAIADSVRRHNQTMGRAAEALGLLAARQSEQSEALQQVCGQLEVVSRQNAKLREALERNPAEFETLRDDVARKLEAVSTVVQSGLVRLASAVRESQEELQGSFNDGMVRQISLHDRTQEALAAVDGQARTLASLVTGAEGRSATAIGGIGALLSAQGEKTDAGLRSLELGLQRMEAGVGQSVTLLESRIGQQTAQIGGLQGSLSQIEEGVSGLNGRMEEGIDRFSQTLERSEGAQAVRLERVAQYQAELGHLLTALAQRFDDNSSKIGEDLRAGLSDGLARVATGMEASQDRLTEALDALARQQDGVVRAIESNRQGTMLADRLVDLGQSMRSTLSEGFEEVSGMIGRNLEVLLAQAAAAAPAQATPYDIEGDEMGQPTEPSVDLDPFVIDLRRQAERVLLRSRGN